MLIDSELEVFCALDKYINNNFGEIQKFAEHLLLIIRLRLFSQVSLKSLVSNFFCEFKRMLKNINRF